jgi:predicted RNA-binding Zn-ribbon protein involved in translation (DUF1610 family)
MDALKSPKLQCDSCHHEVDVEAITKDLIGTPCPVCGDSMLTPEHWRSYQRVRVWIWASRLLGWLMFWEKPKTYEVEIGRHSLSVKEKG